MAEPTHIIWTEGARAQTRDPKARTTDPMMVRRRCPNRSPSMPKVSSNTTTGIINPAVIQVSCEPTVPKYCWNVPFSAPGRALASCATSTATAAAKMVPLILAMRGGEAASAAGLGRVWSAVGMVMGTPGDGATTQGTGWDKHVIGPTSVQ
jgi:hypothetical protein